MRLLCPSSGRLGLAAALAVLAALVVAFGGSPTTERSPATSSSTDSSPASPVATLPGVSAPGAGTGDAAQQAALQATRVARVLLSLVDEHRYGDARRLLEAPRVWPPRELRAVRRVRFLSARVRGDPEAEIVRLAVRCRVGVGRRSSLAAQTKTLFFTVTKTGTTGDWLASAIATRPEAHGRRAPTLRSDR